MGHLSIKFSTILCKIVHKVTPKILLNMTKPPNFYQKFSGFIEKYSIILSGKEKVTKKKASETIKTSKALKRPKGGIPMWRSHRRALPFLDSLEKCSR